LVFDPGARGLYGINIEWTGRLIEATSGQTLEDYFRERISTLGMKDSATSEPGTARAPGAAAHTPGPTARSRCSRWRRLPVKAEFWAAGGPLYSTHAIHGVLTMLLNGGSFNGADPQPETVALMNQNHTGNIPCGCSDRCPTCRTTSTSPGADVRWGLAT